jgi:hypothetical protein
LDQALRLQALAARSGGGNASLARAACTIDAAGSMQMQDRIKIV